MKIRLGLLGVGSHCRNEHLPALRHLTDIRKEQVHLSAVCDLNRAAADEVAADLGFERVFDDLEAMLSAGGLDGIIAVTPIPLTAAITSRIMEAGIPVLMEKPIGSTIEEAETLVKTAVQTGTPVMVGLNRRLDPVMRQVFQWLEERDVQYARAVIHRQHRLEHGFIYDAVLHPVDVLCAALGAGEVE